MKIVRIQRFSTHDGDGVRTVVFVKGCPLHCAWCHNPETQRSGAEIFFKKNACIGCGGCVAACKEGAHFFEEGVHRFDRTRCVKCMACVENCVTDALEKVGTDMTVGEISEQVLRDAAFFGARGGLTVSGGEPMAQPEECIALLREAKSHGLTTAVETCGYYDGRYTKELCGVTDCFLWDYKDSDPERHRAYTGVGTEKILENLFEADRYAKRIILRCIVAAGVNDDRARLDGIAEIYGNLKHCDGVELIAYHAYAGGKSEQLGGADNGNPAWIPSEEKMRSIKEYLRARGVKVL